jgi:hypothetical protein
MAVLLVNATGAAEKNSLIPAHAPAKTSDFVNGAERPRGSPSFVSIADEVVEQSRSLLWCIWQPLALSEHSDSACECPLSGGKADIALTCLNVRL